VADVVVTLFETLPLKLLVLLNFWEHGFEVEDIVLLLGSYFDCILVYKVNNSAVRTELHDVFTPA
jgi:hypothetical protein